MSRVLVLNATYEPVNVTTVRRAVVLLLKEKAEVIEHDNYELHSETTTLASPAVIRLVAYVRIPYGNRKRITRTAIFARDGWSCLYCGSGTKLTVDHVVPRSLGGEHSWTNLVSCCSPCNHKKGHSTLKEAGMQLRHKPIAPKRDIFVYVSIKVPPVAWRQYLAG